MRKFSWVLWIAGREFGTRSAREQHRKSRAYGQAAEQLESRILLSGSPPTINPGQIFNLLSTKDVGAVVGTVQASDPEMESLQYAITGGNNGAFAINATTGQVTVANKSLLNALGSDTVLTIQVAESVAPIATVSNNVTVHLNRPPIAFNQTLTVPTTSATGQEIGTIAASDVEPTSSLAYFIVQGNESGVFVIDSAGKIKVTNGLLYNSLSFPKTLTVEVRDNGTPQGVTSISVILTTNHAPVVVDQTLNVPGVVANGTALGTINVSDADPGQTQSFAFILGNESNAFAISSNGTVTVADLAAFNSLTFPKALTVQVTDNGSPAFSATALITINRNQAPVLADNQTFTVLSTDVFDDIFGMVVSADADSNQGRTFTLLTDGNGAFAITPDGKLKVKNQSIVNGLGPQTSLTVKVTDDGSPNLSDTAEVIVFLNHAPLTSNQTLIVPTTANVGTVLATVVASDADAGQTLSYFVTEGNENGVVAISANGVITVNNRSLYEQSSIISLKVAVRDNGVRQGIATAMITLQRNAPPVITDQAFDVPANYVSGTEFGTIVATDADTASGQTLSFTLTNGNASGAFALDPATGRLKIANVSAFNALSLPSVLTVEVRDNAPSPTTRSATITIRGNRAPVIADQTLTVPVDAQVGTTVGIVVATDPDSHALSYAITNGNAVGAVAINATTGIVTIANKAAYDGLSLPLTLTVQVTDNGTTPRTASATVILKGNRAPVLADQVVRISAAVAVNATIATFSASDPDAGQQLTYSILSGNNGAFAINPMTGVVTVENTAKFNALSLTTTLVIQVVDNGVSVASDTATLTVIRNTAPVVNDQTFEVPANASLGLRIGKVDALDPDTSIGQTLSFAIIGGNSTGAFAIDAVTGVLTIANLAAFNTLSFPWDLTVEVQDSATPPGSDTAKITIAGNHAPVILPQSLVVPPSTTEPGTDTVVAFDADAHVLTYSIVGGNTGGAFLINPVTGRVTVANPTAFDNLPLPHNITVKVQDSGSPALSDEATITILGNHAPVVENQTFQIPFGATTTTAIGKVQVKDVDTNQTMTFQLIGGESVQAFTVDNTGVIRLASDGVLAGLQLPLVLTVQVFDNGVPAKSDTAEITLTGAGNQPPTLANVMFTAPVTGNALGQVTGTDPDVLQTLTYRLEPSASASTLAIDPLNGVLTIANRAAFDSLTFPVKVLVTVQDNGVPSASATALVTINQSATGGQADIHFDTQLLTMPTSLQQGGVVGTVFAYAIEAVRQQNAPVLRFSTTSEEFSIDPLTGVLTSRLALQTAASVKTIQVTAALLNSPNVSVTRPVTVTIVSTANHIPVAQNLEVSIDENSKASTPVGKITASPSDAGERLTFSIAETSLPRAFGINSQSGEITINDDALLDYEKVRVIYLRVKVSDDGKAVTGTSTVKSKPLSTFVTVTISLNNVVNEPPTFTMGTRGPRTYKVGSDPVRLDPDAVFRVPGSPASGGFTNVTLNVSATPADNKKLKNQLRVVSDAPGIGNISVAGKSIVYGNTVIGLLEGGTLKQPNLKITLNSAATAESIQALLRRIGFKGAGVGERQVTVALSGNSGIPAGQREQRITVNVIR